MISRLPQILPKQNTDFVQFLCTNILNWPLNLHGKKKPYLAKTLPEPIDLTALLSAPNSNEICMQQSEAAIDSALIQWHKSIVRMTDSSPMMLGDPVEVAIILQGVRATLDHNPVKM